MKMGEKEINITYETLFELLRREKSREELQKLETSFFSDVDDYIKEKKEIIKSSKEELFSAENSENIKKQIENAKKIIKELHEKREKKIADIAIHKSRTSSKLIDESVFLGKEKELFNALVDLFSKYRKDVLMNILNNETEKAEVEEEEGKEIKQEETKDKEEKKEGEGEKEEDVVLIRFLHAVPKFVGKELETYGPFEAEDVASLPKDIAKVLIDKGRAEKIEENQS